MESACPPSAHSFRVPVLLLPLLLCLLLLSACAEESRKNGLPDGPILIPTLDLMPIEEPQPNLSAELIGQQNGVNIHSFTNAEAEAGFLAPPDEHVLFLSPQNPATTLQVHTVHGSPVLWNEVRYWGYEYSGNETANRAAGKAGRALFDGRFWLSQGERNVTQALYGYLHTPGPNGAQMHMTRNKLYYLMVDGGAGVSGNPGLQGRPFIVCTGERGTCERNLGFGNSSSTASSIASSTQPVSSSMASDASVPVACAAPSLCPVTLIEGTCENLNIDCQSPSNPGSFVAPIPTGETCGTPACAGICVVCPTAGSSSAASSQTSSSPDGQVCDQWEIASAFLTEHCSAAETNEEMLTCYNVILMQWNGLGEGTPPTIPDINCSGTGDVDDVILLTDLILDRYPLTP